MNNDIYNKITNNITMNRMFQPEFGSFSAKVWVSYKIFSNTAWL